VSNDGGFDAFGFASFKDGIVGDVILPIDLEQLMELLFMKLLVFFTSGRYSVHVSQP